MSVESISKVLNADLDITPTQKFVLVGIANHDGDGGAWPSINTLARYVGITPRSVQRALKELERCGLIVRHLNEGGTARTRNHSRPNLYELRMSPPDAHVTPPPDAHVTPPVTPTSPEPSIEPSSEPSTPLKAPQGAVAVPDWINIAFVQWWDAYPRKVGKPAAFKAYKKHVKKLGDEDDVMFGTQRWISVWRASDTDQQFIPHPTTFLNQERFNDIPAVEAPKTDPMSILQRIADRDQ